MSAPSHAVWVSTPRCRSSLLPAFPSSSSSLFLQTPTSFLYCSKPQDNELTELRAQRSAGGAGRGALKYHRKPRACSCITGPGRSPWPQPLALSSLGVTVSLAVAPVAGAALLPGAPHCVLTPSYFSREILYKFLTVLSLPQLVLGRL